MAGIYVHIPFCKSRCAYCDFYSTTSESLADDYVRALCCEIRSRRNELGGERIRTVYVGGGTPSRLAVSQLQSIFDCICESFDVDPAAEVTVEMNPEDWPLSNSPRGAEEPVFSDGQNENVGLAALTLMRGAGRAAVNRISLGIQSFDDDILALIRRRHNAATAVQAVRKLQEAGISNISIDLIYGLPGQTFEGWQRDLDVAFSLGIQHLSAYALSYEPGTALTRWRDEGRIREADDELSVRMYELLCSRARNEGFEHYEISNFARPGFRSRHNSSYWTGLPYLGFGPGAHSFDGHRTRRANNPSLVNYIHYWNEPSSAPGPPSVSDLSSAPGLPSALRPVGRDSVATFESLTADDLYDEAVMCALRTSEGIDLAAFKRRFGEARLAYLLRMAAPHISAGRLILTSSSFELPSPSPSRLAINEKSLMMSDDIMSDLMA